MSFHIEVVHRLLSCSLLQQNPPYKCLWKSLEISMKMSECNCHSESCCHEKKTILFISMHLLTPASFKSFSHTMTTCSHDAFSNMIVSSQMHIPFPQPPTHLFSLPLDIRSSLAQCGKLFDGDTKLSSSSIPQLAQFLATNKIRLSVSQWFGKTQSAARYHNDIIPT